jgi:two-component system response regulator PilR (NtrC family)
VDVRILAATNTDIERAVAEGQFRRDLYYRLNVIRIALPALRERPEDLELLVEAFLKRFASELGKDVTGISRPAFRALKAYPFPGNVRELENILERAVALSEGPVLELDDLPDEVVDAVAPRGPFGIDLPDAGCHLDDVLADVERRLIVQALARTGSVKKAAADLLGITFRSMRYRLNKLSIAVEDDGEPESSEDGR